MDLQVEVQFTIQHTIEELREAFVQKGHFPDWRVADGGDTAVQVFLETRVVSVNLHSPEDRQAWFVFSLEACGELRRCIVIPHLVPSRVNTHIADLRAFLDFCRTCLVGSPGAS